MIDRHAPGEAQCCAGVPERAQGGDDDVSCLRALGQELARRALSQPGRRDRLAKRCMRYA